MRNLLAVAALVLALGACEGNGDDSNPTPIDSYPYPSGQVIGKDTPGDGYALRLSHNGGASGWQPVGHTVYNNCPVGSTWRELDPAGC